MTLVGAWVREVGRKRELVFAADSRLRLAGRWDCCPKIFLLPRSDALMAFAGETWWAYPIILQTINNIATFGPSRSRSLDLLDARGHALRVINDMILMGDALDGPEPPEAEFLFGGFSANEVRFRLWRFAFDETSGRYQAERIAGRHLGQYRFIGDVAPAAETKLHLRMQAAGKPRGPLDMEPLQVLTDLLREASDRATVGGPPQVAKVYPNMTSQIIAVDWSRDGAVPPVRTVVGRPILEYEQAHIPVINADDPTPSPPEGRGVQLRRLDEALLGAIRLLNNPTPDALSEWVEATGEDISQEDQEDWLDFAERRGVISQMDGMIHVEAESSSEVSDEGSSTA
jgi:hypothetical protein